ncbi:cilia-and flagella-associated protein 96 isoform X2 [Hoplias malabaricus]|uniref:cilia-and flagella-associated protein 96 isoform X2 n=1 Tax=Hoplias malabaricus TaxID=27720 RepID=UPI003462D2F6
MDIYIDLCCSFSVPLWVAPLLHAASRLKTDQARRRKVYRLIHRKLMHHKVGCSRLHKPTYVYPAELRQIIRTAFPRDICDYQDPSHDNVSKMPPEGKSDMERVGVFKEMGYISIGDKYTPFIYRPFNESAHKNKQILCGGHKTKSALQAGYFDTQFKRIFEKEALTDLIKIQRQYRINQAKRNLGKAFLPSSGEKKPSGIGSYYGTLGGPIQAMSPVLIARKPYKSPGKNMYTSPPKKGSGYGYPGVTLSKLDLYSSDPYDRAKEMLKHEIIAHKAVLKGGPFRLNLHPKECFDSNPYKIEKPLPASKKTEEKKTHFAVPFKPSSPSKKIGGMKAGTFDLYPSHSADPYIPQKSKLMTVNKNGKIFHPSPGPKSTPVKSIVSLNVNKFVNPINYNQVPSVMAY